VLKNNAPSNILPSPLPLKKKHPNNTPLPAQQQQHTERRSSAQKNHNLPFKKINTERLKRGTVEEEEAGGRVGRSFLEAQTKRKNERQEEGWMPFTQIEVHPPPEKETSALQACM